MTSQRCIIGAEGGVSSGPNLAEIQPNLAQNDGRISKTLDVVGHEGSDPTRIEANGPFFPLNPVAFVKWTWTGRKRDCSRIDQRIGPFRSHSGRFGDHKAGRSGQADSLHLGNGRVDSSDGSGED